VATPIPVNHARFSVGEVLTATGGRGVDLSPGLGLAGVSTDTRALAAGGLFLALRGAHHDGHRFVSEARQRGGTVLVAAEAGVSGPRIEVADPLLALAALARAHVDKGFENNGRRPVLAIGGAAGKTTTKFLTVAAARALLGEVLFTAGNINNRIGVPMTLLTLEPRHRAVVLECGTSERGEIAALAAITRHDVGLVTNVGVEHSFGLGTLDEIADEEAGLLAAARRAAITNADEPELVARLRRVHAPRTLTFGASESADVRLVARHAVPAGGSELELWIGPALAPGATDRRLVVASSLLGPGAAMNTAAALTGALALLDREPDRAELAAVVNALAEVEAVPGRMRPLTLAGVLVLDDCYNSNPKSLGVALATAAEQARARPGGRLVLALGDMLELGEVSADEHDAMVRAADALGADRLLLAGPESSTAAERVRPVTPTASYPESSAAAAEIVALVRAGDTLLVKGSRGTRMERVIEALGGEGPESAQGA